MGFGKGIGDLHAKSAFLHRTDMLLWSHTLFNQDTRRPAAASTSSASEGCFRLDAAIVELARGHCLSITHVLNVETRVVGAVHYLHGDCDLAVRADA